MFWINLWRPRNIIYFIENMDGLEITSEFNRIERIFQTTMREKSSYEILFTKTSMNWDQMMFWHHYSIEMVHEMNFLTYCLNNEDWD